jgi:putative LysE/RhtB family amino acid efflux pump
VPCLLGGHSSMVYVAVLSGFLMGFVGSMPPTGPVTVLVLERGISGRHRDGLAIGAGAAVAESLYCGLALFGMTALFERYPVLERISLGLGILVLMGVGTYFLLFKGKPQAPLPPQSFRLGAWLGQFGLGFSLAAANPVILLTWSASVLALCTLAQLRFDAPDKAAFVGAACVGILAWFWVLLSTLRRFEGRVTLRAAEWLIRAMGAVLLVMAAASLPRALR